MTKKQELTEEEKRELQSLKDAEREAWKDWYWASMNLKDFRRELK
jgi:hypothetical protein